MTGAEELERRLSELRAAFDASFARPPQPAAATPEELLAISVAGDVYAVRLREVGGLEVDRTITSVPSALPHFIGLAAVRNELIAVYDLALMLGYPNPGSPRFMLLARAARAGFACSALIGHVRAPAALPADPQEQRRLREVVPVDGTLRPIVELSVLLSEIDGQLKTQANPETH